jgi:hypothetical protein
MQTGFSLNFGGSTWFDASRDETFPQQKNPREGRKLRKAFMKALPAQSVVVSVSVGRAPALHEDLRVSLGAFTTPTGSWKP